MGEWKKVKLGDYLVEHTEKTTRNNQYPVLTSSREGIFLQTDYYNRVVASKDNTGYNVVPYGYFTYRHMSDDVIFRFNINNIVEKGIVSTLYPVFTTRNINDYFLQTLLNYGSEFKKFAFFNQQGLSRTYVYFSMLKKLNVTIPGLPEQNRIAAVLVAADEAITMSRAMVQKYTAIKQGLMRDLLSNGERVRLDSGIVQINPYCREKRPESFFYIDLEAVIAGEITKDVIVSRKEAPSRAQRLLKPNDILFQTVRPYLQNNYLFRKERELKTVASTGYAQIRTDNNPVYMYYALHQNEFVQEVNNRSTGSSYPAINPTELGKCSIRFETDRAKQDEIANILTAADERLTAERERLAKLENINRGLRDDLLTNRVSTDILKGGREYA